MRLRKRRYNIGGNIQSQPKEPTVNDLLNTLTEFGTYSPEDIKYGLKPNELDELDQAFKKNKDRKALQQLTEAVASPETIVLDGEIYPPYYPPEDGEQLLEFPIYDMPAAGRIEGTPLVDLGLGLAAYFAGPTLLRGANYAYSPMMLEIPGLAGVTGDAILNAYMAYEGLTDLPEALKELKENPNLKTLGTVGLDLLMSAPVIRNVSGKVKGTVDAVAGERNLAKTQEDLYNPRTKDLGYADVVSSGSAAESGALKQLVDRAPMPRGDAELRQALGLVDTPVETTTPILQQLALSDKTIPTLGQSRLAPLVGSGLLNQPKATQDLSNRLVESGLYSSADEASAAIEEIRNPSMNTVLPTSGKTIGQIIKENESNLLDYYTNPLAKDRLTEVYGGVRGSSKIRPEFLPGLSRYHADPADLLKYQQNYGLTGAEILDEIYNNTGMLPRYYASIDKIKNRPSFGDIAKGMDLGVYDEPFDDFYYRRLMEKSKANLAAGDAEAALIDAVAAKKIKKNLKNAAAVAAPDPITGVKKIGVGTSGLNAIGALETFGLSELAKLMIEGTKVPISYAENYLADVIYHELNHVIWGQEELPIELIDGWTPYMTQAATEQMYKGGSQAEMLQPGWKGRPTAKGIFQYKSQPEEIQARMGQTRRHLEVSLGYTKDEIENIALAAREEGGEAMLGKQGGMSFFGNPDGAGGTTYVPENLVKIENKLKELGVVNENRSLQQVLDDLTEAAQRSDENWYNKVIGVINEEQKAQSLMGLLWRVPVYIGVAGAADAMTEEQEDLPVLGYAKGGVLKAMAKKNRPDKNKFVSKKVRILRKEGKGLKQSVAIALDMWRRKKKKYGAGGSVDDINKISEFGSGDGFIKEEFKTNIDYTTPNKTYTGISDRAYMYINPNTEEHATAYAKRLEKEIDRRKKAALAGAGTGAATGGKEFGAAGAIIGALAGGMIGMYGGDMSHVLRQMEGEGGYKDIEGLEHLEGITILKDGGKLNSLVDKMKEKRARRIQKTPVRDASSQEVLEMLASYGADSPMMRAEYSPENREIVVYKTDDPDVLKHEQVHARQYGPLQRLARKMDKDYSARIQDPKKRRSYRKLSRDISPEVYETFNDAGKFILGQGEEFEAVLTTAVNAAKEMGVDFTGSFDDIKNQLKAVQSPTNNMTGLMKFMENTFTDKQKDLILQALR